MLLSATCTRVKSRKIEQESYRGEWLLHFQIRGVTADYDENERL